MFNDPIIRETLHRRAETRMMAYRIIPENFIADMKETLGEKEVALRLLSYELAVEPDNMRWEKENKDRLKRIRAHEQTST